MGEYVKHADDIVVAHDDGIVTTFTHEGDNLVCNTYQDAEPILEANKVEFNECGDDKTGGKVKSGWGRKIADIPLNVWLLWKEKYGIDALDKNHAAGVRRLLNSNEWRHLRTAPGQLAR